jgi:hypothetical protein
MISFIRSALALLVLAAALPAHAALKVLATTADWGALANEIGGDQVNVYVATSALQDVHRVDAKPSLVARARTADLVFASGAELEIGWLPVLIQESGNSRIQPGSPGYFEAASVLTLLEKPEHSATFIRKAIRTYSSIRTTSLALRRLSPSGWRNSTAHMRSTSSNVRRTSIRVGRQRSSVGRARPHRSRASRSWSCIVTRHTCVSGWA